MGCIRHSESGNIFLAIFGAVAMVGLLGASVMTFMKGPLSTSVKLTKINTAESQMTIGAQVAVMAAANQAGSGDCDSDGIVEPIEWRNPTGSEPFPAGGGLVPLSLGINKRDPWGTEYGYCVWNHGSATSGTGCGTNLIAGSNSTAYSVVALISAGPDKTFTTTCRSFATSDANSNGMIDDSEDPLVSKNLETDDDIITTFTYQEATGVSGGLWSLKAGDPGTAVINKSIESTGVANLKGGVLLPDKSLLDCNDPLNAGVMAKNGTTGIEICDGAGVWTAITGGGVTGNNLVLTPVVSSGMNVNGTCGTATCYSAQTTFTLTNKAATTSPVLATSLSNMTNFEFVSNGCNGQTLATNGECQMVVRAKATGNVSYAGTLNVTGENSPFATLDGTASSFPGCNAGGQAPGGYYVGCGIGGYNLVITPSGCTSGMTNPTCSGSTDTLQLTAFSGTGGHIEAADCCSSSDGQKNTSSLMAYSAGSAVTYPAAAWCDGLVYQGFSDWFLPSTSELTSYFYPNRTAVGWTNTQGYWSSNEYPGQPGYWRDMTTTGGFSNVNNAASITRLVRCMRWTPDKAVTPIIDTTPTTLTFATSYGGPTETRTSNAVTITGITQPISISVSGGTNAEYSINGAAYTSAAGTVTVGDQVSLRATSPVAGQENVIALTTGSITTNWLVRTPGNNVIRIFTTSANAGNGAMGVGGADSICSARASAAGLPGSWTAIIAGYDVRLDSRLPWNWTTLKNMNGQTVAISVTDFLDGTVAAPMNYSETGVLAASGQVWTGLFNNGGIVMGGNYTASTCQNFSTTASGIGKYGDTAQTGGYTYFSNGEASCATSMRLLCMETNAAGADLDPEDVVLTPGISFASGGDANSNTVTVTGVTDAVNVSITPSSGTASIIKNGVNLNATSTTAGLNETLAFVLSAPTSLGTKNTATINIGPDAYNWWVGYADQAIEARIFAMVSGEYAGLGGLPGADNLCTQEAATSSMGLSGNWKAVLSTSSTNAADNIPWNWGVLKTVDGTTVVDGGFPDLWDGTLDAPINRDKNGVLQPSRSVWSGTNSLGGRVFPSSSISHCFDWTSGGSTPDGYCGTAGNTTSGWIAGGVCSCYGTVRSLYCIEDIAMTTDTTPANITPAYPVQVATSSRHTSEAVVISGMSSGATTTLSVTATGGTPTFRVNGGAEVTSATIQNGDSVVFLMTAPSIGNSNNRMTMTVSNGATVGYWRVWTGDTTGAVVKRAFVLKFSSSQSSNQGGVTGLDSRCQTAAASASLGGTWRAIASGVGDNESEWAVNRIGYNWSTLRRIDGADIVLAGNIWKTDTVSLLNPIAIDATGVTQSSSVIKTGTNFKGFAAVQLSTGQCVGWSSTLSTAGDTYTPFNGTSGTTGIFWINNGGFGNEGAYNRCSGGSLNGLTVSNNK